MSRNLLSAGFTAIFVFSLSACSKQAAPSNPISAANLRTNNQASDTFTGQYRVMREDVLKSKADEPTLLSAASGDATKFLKTSPLIDPRTVYQGKFSDSDIPPTDTANDTLIVGLPIGTLGEERVLGGIITAVSDHTNTDLGNLKLSDLPMSHGKLMLAALNGNTPQLILVGCNEDCAENSARTPLVSFPIAAVDTQNSLLMLDLSAVGKDLDLISLSDPDGSYTGMKSISSAATKFDFSLDTLVFDIESKLTAADPKNTPMPDTSITVRWYFKSAAAFDPSFESRPATKGVGFFMTDTAKNAKIRRWSLSRFGNQGEKYYLKHVPTEWQPAFASAFDEWNTNFQAMFGRNAFEYEFIPENDPRNDLLVTGDIRYNIVEWDLQNLATYGGLGPSESNEYSGETISANVLIQGPTIINLYTDWFKVTDQAQILEAQGKTHDAAELLHNFSLKADASLKTASSHSLRANARSTHALSFTIHSERPEIADPYAQRNDFEMLPPNVDFKSYMNGYFHDMLTHELGHNLGLRHNFRGNLGATDTGASRSVSRSVMEYLGRGYRYLDGVGEYDLMALKYGYSGVAPTHFDWFCTDEDAYSAGSITKSAECSANDATSDPYGFFEARLTRAIDFLTARGTTDAPVWEPNDMGNELTIALTGLLSYADASESVATTWTNFFGKNSRPSDAKNLRTYVVARVKQQLCDPSLEDVIASKLDPAAQKLTRNHLVSLREGALEFFKKADVDLGFDANCVATAAPMPLVIKPKN